MLSLSIPNAELTPLSLAWARSLPFTAKYFSLCANPSLMGSSLGTTEREKSALSVS